MLDNFDSLATGELALEWDRAHTAYLAIMRAVGRVKVLTKDKQTLEDEAGLDPYLEDQFSLAFVNGREALSKANANDRTTLAIARENIIVPLVKGFLNGVLHEVEGVIANSSIDVDAARIARLGGDLLYRTVEVFIAQDNPSGNDRIKAQLGDSTDVVANEIVSDINKGVIGQFRRNISQTESTFGVDRNRALLASERISLYATIFLPDLELRLGTQQRVKMQNALQDLREAIETDNSAKAITAGSTITEIISAYEDELV